MCRQGHCFACARRALHHPNRSAEHAENRVALRGVEILQYTLLVDMRQVHTPREAVDYARVSFGEAIAEQPAKQIMSHGNAGMHLDKSDRCLHTVHRDVGVGQAQHELVGAR